MKRIIALLLALLCVVTALAACGGSNTTTTNGGSSIDQIDAGKKKIQKSTEGSSDDRKVDTKASGKTADLKSSFDGMKNIDYVMIYNPDIYDEYVRTNKKLSTGDLSKWIDTDVNRADGLKEESAFQNVSMLDIPGELDVDADMEAPENRAGGLAPTYKEGDTHKFFYSSGVDGELPKGDKFTCVKEGKKCYVWMLDSDKSKKSEAEALAKEFDEKIYDKDVSLFGQPRFVDGGGKVNLLFHPMYKYYAGYFNILDLFTTEEAMVLAKYYTDVDLKTMNTDHAIIHINSSDLGKKSEMEYLKSTIAHEFQHLINFTSSIEGIFDLNRMNKWLNEGMSAYIEDALYSGIKEKNGFILAYEYSDRIRNGQSLYNFDFDDKDPGTYGSVFIYTKYLDKAAGGSKVFKKIHDAWRKRKTPNTYTTAESLYSSVSDSYKKSVGSLVSYPSAYKFNSKDEEWMSKMALDFYLSQMKYDSSDPAEYKKIHIERMLYDQVKAAKLEGGGRVIFKTKDGKFSIPSDADSKLVYVGFDKNFNQVTDIICK